MPTFPVGVVLFPPPVQPVLRSIRLAEQVGLPMAWVPSWPVGPDALSVGDDGGPNQPHWPGYGHYDYLPAPSPDARQ